MLRVNGSEPSQKQGRNPAYIGKEPLQTSFSFPLIQNSEGYPRFEAKTRCTGIRGKPLQTSFSYNFSELSLLSQTVDLGNKSSLPQTVD